MGKVYDAIDIGLRAFIDAQRVFFVATAPAGRQGHVNVVRLHGRGRVVLPAEPEFGRLLDAFPGDPGPGLRSIIEVVVSRVSDSCGFQVPLLEYVGDRDLLTRWIRRRSDDELQRYRATHNARSIDGLPALESDPPPAT